MEDFAVADFEFAHLGDHLFEARFLFVKERVLDGVATCYGEEGESEEFGEGATGRFVFFALANRIF